MRHRCSVARQSITSYVDVTVSKYHGREKRISLKAAENMRQRSKCQSQHVMTQEIEGERERQRERERETERERERERQRQRQRERERDRDREREREKRERARRHCKGSFHSVQAVSTVCGGRHSLSCGTWKAHRALELLNMHEISDGHVGFDIGVIFIKMHRATDITIQCCSRK